VSGTGLLLAEEPGERFARAASGQSAPPHRAAFYARDRIVLLDGPLRDTHGEFLREPDGRISRLRLGLTYKREP
jgi:hypothetical protein